MSVAPNPVVIASSAADAAAVDAVVSRHAELSGALQARIQQVFSAVVNNDVRGAEHQRAALVAWCGAELVPLAEAEAAALYPAARADPRGRLLVDAMLAEHQVLLDLVEAIRKAVNPVVVAASAYALRVVVESRLAQVDDIVLPLLAAAPQVSLAALVEGMDIGGSEAPVPVDTAVNAPVDAAVDATMNALGNATANAPASCGEHDGEGFPELDATAIPHAIRHATIFGALEGVVAGGGLVLLAPHAPLPLLRQIDARWPDRFEVTYLQEGPDIWKVQFTHA